MKKVITILFLISSFYSFAQNSYIVQGEGSFGLNMPYDILIKPDNNVLYLVNTADAAAQSSVTDIHELSPQGEILQRITLADTSISSETALNLFQVEDTVYVISTGQRVAEKENTIIVMRKLDLQLNTIDTYHIGLELGNCDYLIPMGKFVYHNGLIEGFLSNAKTNGIIRPFFVRLTKYGEVIKLMEDSATMYNHRPFDFLYRPDNLGYYVFELVIEASGSFLYCYDQELNVESICELPYDGPVYVSALHEDDDSFYFAQTFYDSYPYQCFRMAMFEMTAGGEIIHEFIHNDIYPSGVAYHRSIDHCPDGSLVLCGTNNLQNLILPQDQPSQILLFKLDDNLEPIWQRYIGSDMGKYDAYAVRCAPNGDIVILANFTRIPTVPPNINQPVFIRTNPDGVITSISDKDITLSSSEALVYPNPAHHQLTIDYSPAYTDAEFALRTIDGKIVLQCHLTENKKILDITALSPGTYIYKLYNSQGLNESGKLVVE